FSPSRELPSQTYLQFPLKSIPPNHLHLLKKKRHFHFVYMCSHFENPCLPSLVSDRPFLVFYVRQHLFREVGLCRFSSSIFFAVWIHSMYIYLAVLENIVNGIFKIFQIGCPYLSILYLVRFGHQTY